MSRSGGQLPAPRADAYPGRVPDMLGWLRRHPWQADGLLALLLVALSYRQWQGDHPAAVATVSVLLAATVVPRRRYPVAAFAVAAAIGAVQIAIGVQPAGGFAQSDVGPLLGAALQPTVADAAILVLLYTLAAHRSQRVSITGLVICLVGAAAAVVRWAPAHTAHSGGAIFAAAVGLGGATLTAWVLGDSVAYRYRRVYYASLEERAARLEAERDAQARIARAAERARELEERRARVVDESAARLRRIERDLHDGAQVRLAALAMTLGEIKESLDAAAAGADGARARAVKGGAAGDGAAGGGAAKGGAAKGGLTAARRPGRLTPGTGALGAERLTAWTRAPGPACWSPRHTGTRRRHSPSCGTSPGASIRQCPTAVSAPHWRPWRKRAWFRLGWKSASPNGRHRPSRPWPTSARRSYS